MEKLWVTCRCVAEMKRSRLAALSIGLKQVGELLAQRYNGIRLGLLGS